MYLDPGNHNFYIGDWDTTQPVLEVTGPLKVDDCLNIVTKLIEEHGVRTVYVTNTKYVHPTLKIESLDRGELRLMKVQNWYWTATNFYQFSSLIGWVRL